ncbi:hypothetical protein Q1695_009807 [Nippostrongylus brasiliensis]|nr:hypothetical protein Q1695_009807 [Nippostrongylus brasiliensis]
MRYGTSTLSRQVLLGVVYAGIFLFGLYMFYRTKSALPFQFMGNNFSSAKDCLMHRVKVAPDLANLWNYFPYYVNKCSPDGGLPILSFANNDEYKYHVMEPTTDCTIVSLGIGKDIEAEKAMKAAMPNCKFWGADPVNDTNADIFTEGRFRYFINNYDYN